MILGLCQVKKGPLEGKTEEARGELLKTMRREKNREGEEEIGSNSTNTDPADLYRKEKT